MWLVLLAAYVSLFLLFFNLYANSMFKFPPLNRAASLNSILSILEWCRAGNWLKWLIMVLKPGNSYDGACPYPTFPSFWLELVMVSVADICLEPDNGCTCCRSRSTAIKTDVYLKRGSMSIFFFFFFWKLHYYLCKVRFFFNGPSLDKSKSLWKYERYLWNHYVPVVTKKMCSLTARSLSASN